MNADEQARKICVPLYRDIHNDLGGTISMGDIAAIIGNRMHDACIEMHNWTLEQVPPLPQGATFTPKCPKCGVSLRSYHPVDNDDHHRSRDGERPMIRCAVIAKENS